MNSGRPGQEEEQKRPAALAERRFAEVREQMRGMAPEAIFDFIYRSNLWGSPESNSGLGSQLDSTARLRVELPYLLASLRVKTLVDIPCGDFSWLSSISLPIEHYIGADIVPSIIERNREKFRLSHPNAEFQVLDLTKDALPSGEVILCRDCLVHLPFALIQEALGNMRRSRIRYAILTVFTGNRINTDIEVGDWRPLNFEKPPFYFPAPKAILMEGCTEEGGAYADKALGVWEVGNLDF